MKALVKLGVLVLDGRLASLQVFLLLLADADLLGKLVPQALQFALQRLAATLGISRLSQGSVSSGLSPEDGLLLLVAGRRGLNQRRTN